MQQTPSPDRRPTSVGGALALPRPPGALRRFWGRHPWWFDSIVAAVYLLFGIAGILVVYLGVGVARPAGETVLLVAATTVAAAALLVRRHRPWLTFVVVWITVPVPLIIDGATDPVGLSIALYSITVYRSVAAGWIAFAASAVVVTTATVTATFLPINAGEPFADPLLGAVILSALYVVPTLVVTLVGTSVAGRRRYEAALVDRAAQLARERDQQARLATAAERARIAREMHDVVSHGLSIMVSLADGADALAEKDATRSREAVREIGDVGRRSLVEMRRMLGVLGSEGLSLSDPGSGESRPSDTGPGDTRVSTDADAPRHPQPSIDDISGLASTFRTAGLPVSVEVEGEPPSAPAVCAALYRIVQESLTNALRYAVDARSVVVQLDYRDGGAEVTVTDDGRTPPVTVPSLGGGRGLIGMRERAALYGGTVTAGPRDLGGWRVHVTLPQAKDDQ